MKKPSLKKLAFLLGALLTVSGCDLTSSNESFPSGTFSTESSSEVSSKTDSSKEETSSKEDKSSEEISSQDSSKEESSSSHRIRSSTESSSSKEESSKSSESSIQESSVESSSQSSTQESASESSVESSSSEESSGKPFRPKSSSDDESVSESIQSTSESSSVSESTTQSTSVSESESESSPSVSSESTSVDLSYMNDSRWNLNFNEYGEDFRDRLCEIMKKKKTVTASYDSCRAITAAAAGYPTPGSTYFIPFYKRACEANKMKVSLGTDSYNREHTWPKSRGSGGTFDDDPFMVRSTAKEDNSDRANNFYGNEKSNEWDPMSCDNYEEARGESARIILYCAVRYGVQCNVSLRNDPSYDKSNTSDTHSMGTLKTLLAWNNKYPATDLEIQINDYLSDHGYGRNPFVDHPEYANYIWDNNGFRSSALDPNSSYNFSESSSSSYTGPTYSRYTDLTNLNGKSLAIVSTSSDYYFAMKDEIKTDTTPWYLKAEEVTAINDGAELQVESLCEYTFTKNTDSTYKITNANGDKLIGYVSGTHYSIGWNSTTQSTSALSEDWVISANGTGFTFKNKAEVYLEYYSNSWCGYNKAPSVPVYLYQA